MSSLMWIVSGAMVRLWRGVALHRCAAIGVMIIAVLPGAAIAQRNSEIEIPLLGVKVIPFEGILPNRRTIIIPEVTAVRSEGPAYFSGIQPGDRLIAIGPNLMLPPDQYRDYVEKQYRAGDPYDIVVSFPLYGANSGKVARKTIPVVFDNPRPGAWITTRLQHTEESFRHRRQELPELAEARATAKQRYQERYDVVVNEIMADPCGQQQRTKEMAQELSPLAHNAQLSTPGAIVSNLADVASRGCANVREGSLPDFEATITAMALKLIDPCAYTPGADYSAKLARARTKITRKEYTTSSLGQLGEKVQANNCLREFIAARLTGRTFVPPQYVETQPAPEEQPALQQPIDNPDGSRDQVPQGGARRRSPRREGEPQTIASGKYEVIRTTRILRQPRSDAEEIARLGPGRKIHVTGTTGMYLKVESRQGREPGYISSSDVRPASSE